MIEASIGCHSGGLKSLGLVSAFERSTAAVFTPSGNPSGPEVAPSSISTPSTGLCGLLTISAGILEDLLVIGPALPPSERDENERSHRLTQLDVVDLRSKAYVMLGRPRLM